MPKKTSDEADIILAIQSFKKGIYPTLRPAVIALGVDLSTVHRRTNGQPSRDDSNANRRKLSKLETEVLVERILDMDARGFACRVEDVADMANILIDEDTRVRRDHVGKT